MSLTHVQGCLHQPGGAPDRNKRTHAVCLDRTYTTNYNRTHMRRRRAELPGGAPPVPDAAAAPPGRGRAARGRAVRAARPRVRGVRHGRGHAPRAGLPGIRGAPGVTAGAPACSAVGACLLLACAQISRAYEACGMDE